MMILHVLAEVCVLYILLSLNQVAGQTYDCPLGWDEYELKCYHFVVYPPRVYAEAMAACQEDGASLVSVNDAREHQFLSQWLTKNDGNRQDLWFTSGTGSELSLKWEGDGSSSQQEHDWWLEASDYNLTNEIVVYKYSVPLGEFGWSRSPKRAVLSYICEISRNEAFRITQAVRDYTYGQDVTDPSRIPRGPKFLNRHPDIVIAGRNPTASIECRASGTPQPTFKWYKSYGTAKQTEVTSSVDERYTLTNGRLTIQAPDSTLDLGSYQCTATNSVGRIISDPIQVSFGYLYEFSNDPPGSLYAALYQGADIMCKVPAYNPALTYQWYKKDAAHFVRPELNDYQFISHNGNLYLSEAQQSDAGFYHCVVTLSVPSGQVMATSQPPSRTSLGIELKVGGETAMDFGPTIHNDFPAVFPSPPLRGQNIRLECLAYGKLPMYYSWTRGDGITNIGLPHNSHLADHNRVLLIDDVRVEDGGNYTCHVNRGASAADIKPLFVTIESRPYFMFPLQDQFLDVGSQTTWRCQATAIPSAEYTWYKDTVLLTSTPGDVEISGNVLTIKNANADKHNGMYQCSAKNMHGESFSTAELKVLSFAPIFSKQPVTDKVASIGGNVTMICNPEAAPKPDFKWSRDGRDLGLTEGVMGRLQLLHNGNLLITSVTSGDAGQYTCTATNTEGSDSSQATLLVSARTEISQVPVDTRVIVNNTAFLYCEASFDNSRYDLVYAWRFNGHPIDISHNSYFVQGIRDNIRGLYIRNAQFIHSGEYTCLAETVEDTASASATLTVQGPPGEPAGVYCDQEGMALNLHWTDGTDRGSPIIYYIVEFNTNFNSNWRVMIQRLGVTETLDDENPDRKITKLASLRPGTAYRFRVLAANMFGHGDPSIHSSMYRLPSAAPVVPPLEVGGGGGRVGTLTITWEPLLLEDESGPAIGYYVFWRRKLNVDDLWQRVNVTGRIGTVTVVVGDQNYYLEYEVMVEAFNRLGPGPNSTVAVIYSAESLPYATPNNIWIDTYNATAIVVYFDAVDDTRAAVKGKIIGYQVNFWVDGERDLYIGHSYHYGQRSQAVVIGLIPNFDYWANVQVFNSAGLGPESEINFGSTAGEGPNAYPEYVEVHSDGPNSVYVHWRGISTVPIVEEALQGYILRYWPANSDLRDATDVVIDGKRTHGVITGLDKGIVYKLRLTGYNAGGDGKKAPPIFFTLGGQIVADPTTSEILATGSHMSSSVLCLLSCALMWILT
ncbi:contactin-like [Haliotis rufescens]|uniref:contactin-like n=1 Tax=Haliotis rufescens TaxID=6454 RepID=UPI00201EA969|nr:contactin-like [Haliotis rufescens]